MSADATERRTSQNSGLISQLERRLSELMRHDRAVERGVGQELSLEEEQTSQREVWYEYINSDTSAMVVTLPDANARLSDIDGDRLVWKPGLEGWTPMREVMSSQRSGSLPDASVEAASSSSLDRETSSGSSRPTDFTHGVHVEVDARTGGLTGLPEDWAGLLPQGCAPDTVPAREIPTALRPPAVSAGTQLVDGPIVGTPYNISKWRPQFGLPLEASETTTVNGYEIPSMLVLLWRTLKSNKGHYEEGIFRISADNEECKEIVAGLNVSGEALSRIGRTTNAHTLSNLIKMWFRLLPDSSKLVTEDMIERILAEGKLDSLDMKASGKACMDLLKGFPPLRQGLFLWLLELMADVTAHKGRNLMSEQNIAIVLAPNLYHGAATLSGGDPMAAVKAMASFVEKLLIYYVAVRGHVRQRASSIRTSTSVPSPPPPPPPASTSQASQSEDSNGSERGVATSPTAIS
mmetsp:Transcript_44077/g.115851  ORF Transcript_44077/g.115851 Transcript_44077/m.115851 type:complete len:463 (+) Transcript_44077:28-1416(+)